MADVFSRQKRSAIMSRIKGRGNQATELRLITIFAEFGIRNWRRNTKIFGKPDFVFRSARVAVFVDGCFWHGCQQHRSLPVSNKAFWKKKIESNIERDRVVNKELKKMGWSVLRIWQHDLRDGQRVARRVATALARRARRHTKAGSRSGG